MRTNRLFDEISALSCERISAQTEYMLCLSAANGGIYDERIIASAEALLSAAKREGRVTDSVIKEFEDSLIDLSPIAKEYTVSFVGQTHIDMNWQWGFDETVITALETLDTVLTLMDEYPEITFAQSQAEIYRIIEKYSPSMLERIRGQISLGRWEVSASTWVEADRNLANGEDTVHQILYAKRYLSKLLDIPPESLNLNYEPDTFGHPASTPEILSSGGIDYFYHCRGGYKYNIYNWRAPSGKTVLAYCDPKWYSTCGFKYSLICDTPLFCEKQGIKEQLFALGYGDHGGGPTRRDLDMIISAKKWPLMPNIRFSTYHAYFNMLKKQRGKFPTFEGELNFTFTGAYSSQSKIKSLMRHSSSQLRASECFDSLAVSLCKEKGHTELLASGWKGVLFSQFHDVSAGSCASESADYSSGIMQKSLAAAKAVTHEALGAICKSIDTEPAYNGEDASVRVIHLFNPSSYERKETVSVSLWDFPKKLIPNLCARDAESGEELKMQFLGYNDEWGYLCADVLVYASLPPLGYSTVIFSQDNSYVTPTYNYTASQREQYNENRPIILENELVSVTFAPTTLEICSFTDKTTGREYLGGEGCFRLIRENQSMEMTSWRVGAYEKITNLNKEYGAHLISVGEEPDKKYVIKDSLSQYFTYEIVFCHSKLTVRAELLYGSRMPTFDCTVDFNETGSEKGIPRLELFLKTAECGEFTGSIPFGEINRKNEYHDVPTGGKCRVANRGAGLVSDSGGSFCRMDNSLSYTILRATDFPDPYPETGLHSFKIGLCGGETFDRDADCFLTPVTSCAAARHGGGLPLSLCAIKIGGNVCLSGIKCGEDGGIIIRVYDKSGEEQNVTLTTAFSVKEAAVVDFNENITDALDISDKISFAVPPFSVVSVRLLTD